MSQDGNSENDDGELHIHHERTLEQTESLTVKHQKGGSSNRSNVRKFVERKAQLDVPDDVNLPSLIDDDDRREAVMEVVESANLAQEETAEDD